MTMAGSIKDSARKLRNRWRASLRRLMLRRGLASLDRQLAAGRVPDTALLTRLVRAWANEAWSTDTTLLAALVEWLPRSKGAIVECGSGLSTLVMGCAARVSGRQLLALEHTASWARRVDNHLPPAARRHVAIAVTPLVRYADFDWYDVAATTLPAAVGFVLCDGPPGDTRGGRYGLLPVLHERLAPGGIVLLDDTQRTEEAAIVERWGAEFGLRVLHRGASYTVMAAAG